MTTKILIVEDHRDLAEVIALSLESSDYIIDYARDGDRAIALFDADTFDLVILDIMLPGKNGLEVCKHIREQSLSDIPILMLTAKDTTEDIVMGLEHGADDYLVKPFKMDELLARVNALIRRQSGAVTAKALSIADIQINPKTMSVTRAGKNITLSPTAFQILTILMRESPNIVSRQALEQELWGDDPPDSDALRSHLYILRQKIDKPFEKTLIRTVKGHGFQLTDAPN